MDISIVIPTYNRSFYLDRCLNTLGRSIAKLDVKENRRIHRVRKIIQRPVGAIVKDTLIRRKPEIIVIDDHSNRMHAEKNKEICTTHAIAYTWLPEHVAPAQVRNIGISKSNAGWIAFLDDDVEVDDSWVKHLYESIPENDPAIVGIEGSVIPRGNGVWDNEVENRSGGNYLSCNIVYKKVVLDLIGGFDAEFKYGPYGEDHELASRILPLGKITYKPELRVYHMPRFRYSVQYLASACTRMRNLLMSEFLFFQKRPAEYFRFRNARTFWGTYSGIMVKHLYQEFKRRKWYVLIANPGQTTILLLGCIIEQMYAWSMVPYFLKEYCKWPDNGFTKHIDKLRTSKEWKLRNIHDVNQLRFRRSVVRSIMFRFYRRPVYNAMHIVKNIEPKTKKNERKIFLRVDDVFFDNEEMLQDFCSVMRGMKQPYLAGVPGCHLERTDAYEKWSLVYESGGHIGIHGFEHEGNYGPYKSELLQYGFSELYKKIDALQRLKIWRQNRPQVFIPPFNSVSAEQIHFLTSHFKVICGGPETIRFTEGWGGAVALKPSGWYIPSVQPLYGSAKEMMHDNVVELLKNQTGLYCITVHMQEEALDNFGNLKKLIKNFSSDIVNWDYFTSNS